MTDRPKAKPISHKTRNDSRRNGKAFKRGGSRGAKSVNLTSVEKILLGQGRFVSFAGVGWEPSTQWNKG